MNPIVQADARHLPFADGSFDVVVADPPYEGITRRRRRKATGLRGYIPYANRDWWPEAWRVLRPSGSLYVFTIIKEMARWYAEIAEAPVDVIAWVDPGMLGIVALYKGRHRLRSKVWRPILHYVKPPVPRLVWSALGGDDTTVLGKPLRRPRPPYAVDPNVYTSTSVNSNHRAALPYPNQLPERLLRWLLRPHRGARVLDLFSGTGTTRAAATGLHLEVVSVELNPQALPMIAQRPAELELF